MSSLLPFKRGTYNGILVRPRWPSAGIAIDRRAWDRLGSVQQALPAGIQLILTRAYEPTGTRTSLVRRIARKTGVRLFGLLYRSRASEIDDIFGANGHDRDGTHVDISISLHGRRLRLLPLGVFTPIRWQNRLTDKYLPAVRSVQSQLINHGFKPHRNKTESLQMHCDLVIAEG